MTIKTELRPTIFTIFGGTGDLTHRKLIPAIYNLQAESKLPKELKIICFAHRNITKEVYLEGLKSALSKIEKVDNKVWKSISDRIIYLQSDFKNPDGYEKLQTLIEQIEKDSGKGIKVFYLATPPAHFQTIISHLKNSSICLTCNEKETRVVIEKPFGHDLKSAEELNAQLTDVFKEEQIFRIDHYLGKETVQNLLVFRFANQIFTPLWNKEKIDHIQITISEDIGIETRGAYYENAGALRDIIQNHAFQVLSLVTMDQPAYFDEKNIRDGRFRIINSIRNYPSEEIGKFVIRGQYKEGEIHGKKLNGYRNEKEVAPDSQTETYIVMKLFIETPAFFDVPIYIRTGKRLKKKSTDIFIKFKNAESLINPTDFLSNSLTYKIQPEEGAEIKLATKIPEKAFETKTTTFKFKYSEEFERKIPDAYQRLLLDIIQGDQTLFIRIDEVRASWRFIDRIRQDWNNNKDLFFYKAGTTGPKEADKFIEKDKRQWVN